MITSIKDCKNEKAFLAPSIIKRQTVKECTENGEYSYSNGYKVTLTPLYMDTSEVTILYIK